jgi:hypothetical protein
MINAVQNLVCSFCSCAMRVVPCRGTNYIRGKCGHHPAGTSMHVSPAHLAGMFACLMFCLLSMSAPARATIWNVQQSPCNATGNGTTDDTSAINTCIGKLQQGDTLLFPAGTYKITSSLVIDVASVTIDGSSNTATILAAFSGSMLEFGNPSGFCIGCSLGPSVSLAFTAGELWPGFIANSSLDVNPGDYVYIHQGGQDYSTDTCVNGGSPPCQGHPTNCDVSGCRGEVLQVQSVSGNTIIVTTALHDTYDPLNAAVVQKVQNPLAGVTLQNITLNGASVASTPLAFYGAVNSTVSGVTITGANDPSDSGSYTLLANVTYGLNLNNITLTSTAVNLAQLGVYAHGNLSINGMTIRGASGGAAFFSSGANDSVANLTVDATGGQGRPFKTTAVRYSTFSSVTVENGTGNFNGISLEYYSSHNTFNTCVATNNSAGTGTATGNAGINLFGNYNQYNTFNNCTVSGNGNIQFLINSSDALHLAQDRYNTVSGGTFTGVSNGGSVMYIDGGAVYIHDATINGPVGSGWPGIYLGDYATYACVNNNTFVGSFPNGVINATAYHDRGSGNNPNNGNLTQGTCP